MPRTRSWMYSLLLGCHYFCALIRQTEKCFHVFQEYAHIYQHFYVIHQCPYKPEHDNPLMHSTLIAQYMNNSNLNCGEARLPVPTINFVIELQETQVIAPEPLVHSPRVKSFLFVDMYKISGDDDTYKVCGNTRTLFCLQPCKLHSFPRPKLF